MLKNQKCPHRPASKIVETVQNEEWAEVLENDFVVRKIKKSKRNIATDYEVVHNENGEVWTQQKINETDFRRKNEKLWNEDDLNTSVMKVMYKDIPWNPLNFDTFLPRRQKRGLYNGQRTMREVIG